MKKRILQLIPSFHSGGSERQAVTLTRLLRDEGDYDIFAATLNKEGALLEDFQALYGSELPEYKLSSFYDRKFVTQVRNFAQFLKENHVELIHTHDFYTNVFGMAAATLAGTRLRVASKRESRAVRTRAQDLVEKIAFGRADVILVNSRTVLDHLKSRGVSEAKMRLIYNGTHIDMYDRNAGETYSALAEMPGPIITLVANLRHSVKNVPMFIRAAKRIASINKDVHFVIAGEGELQTELQRFTAELRIEDRVHFIGRCDNIPELLKASYACVLTSTAEGFSNSLIEYMAASKPVVATDVGGASEAVQEAVTGYLVKSDDDAALADRLLLLLANEWEAKRMGRAGYTTVAEKFSLRAQLCNIKMLYADLCEK